MAVTSEGMSEANAGRRAAPTYLWQKFLYLRSRSTLLSYYSHKQCQNCYKYFDKILFLITN